VVLKYLQTNNQSSWTADHPIIDYRDTDRQRGWDDVCEFDTAWVQERNLRENLFRIEINQHHKDINDKVILQEKFLEAGKWKKHCIIDKEFCDLNIIYGSLSIRKNSPASTNQNMNRFM
jgi:hypothetical protein